MEDQKISKDGSKTQEVEVQKKMAETEQIHERDERLLQVETR